MPADAPAAAPGATGGVAPASPTGRPAVCEIRDWVAFGEGYHKGTLYTRDMNRAMGANFQRLSMGPNPAVGATVKIGHDFEERSAESLGFPSFGTITRCEVEPNGLVHLWLANVPTQVGAAINADLFKDGSIEIAPPLPNPDDQSQKLYPVLTGIALLGEEQPEVKLRHPIPRAVFADGTSVPPETDVTKWLQVMAAVAQAFSAAVGQPRERKRKLVYLGKTYSVESLCFSAMTPVGTAPMNPELEAKLAPLGLTPEQVQAVIAALGGAPAAPAAPATPPPAAPDRAMSGTKDDADKTAFAELSAKFAAFTEETNKRFGSLTAFAEDAQKKGDEEKMAAMSATVATRCKALLTKVEPVVIENVIKPTALGLLTSKTFSAETDRIKAFNDYLGRYETLADDKRLVTAIQDGPTGKPGALTDLQRMIAESPTVRRYAPTARKLLLEADAKATAGAA